MSLGTSEKKILIEGGSSLRYSPSGHLIYARGGKLLAVVFDPDTLQVLGQPFPVVDGVNGQRLTYRSWKTETMTMWWMPADR